MTDKLKPCPILACEGILSFEAGSDGRCDAECSCCHNVFDGYLLISPIEDKLKEYAQHKWDCQKLSTLVGGTCTCGLEELL